MLSIIRIKITLPLVYETGLPVRHDESGVVGTHFGKRSLDVTLCLTV